MERLLRFLEKYIIPKFVYQSGQPIYHWLLGFFGALLYGFPSKRMFVIGVTGTKGKTTTCNLIHHIFNSSGIKCGLSTTVNFKIGDEEFRNNLKQTMPGRFYLQNLLKKMADAGCKYAVIETSSEGILQFRHRFIDYDAAIFLNLSPEHLDRHKGFENYRSAKLELFKKVAKKENSVGVYNLDSKDADFFLEPAIPNKYGFKIANIKVQTENNKFLKEVLEIKNIKLNQNGAEFTANGEKFKTQLVGEFNVHNCVAAIITTISQNVPINKIKEAISTFKSVAGRMEIINSKKGFSVIVDYAHEPSSLEYVYRAVSEAKLKEKNARMICLLGSCGGGRDVWKRPAMGKIAANYCDDIILANEDPYDEDPMGILNEIKDGILEENFPQHKVKIILDRKEAIKTAIAMAKKGDAVVLTGKGGEMWMCLADNRKIEWNEKQIVEEELKKSPLVKKT